MKKYSFVVEEDDDKKLHFKGECFGFHGFELYGFLAFKLDDIRRQISGEIKPDFIERKIIKDKKNIRIIDEEKSHIDAIKLYKRDEQYGCSTGIDDTITYGYGKLDDNGFFEFPIYFKDEIIQ